MADIGDVVGRLRLEDEFSVPVAKMQQTLMGLARTFAPAVAGALSVAGAFKVLKDSVDAAAHAESVVAQLNSAIVSTGGVAGKTTEGLQKMARELSKTFGVEDEEILQAQTNLLKFEKISGDVFDRATKDMIDMSARMGMGISGAAQMIGRALENPTNGMMMLRRAGVTLGDSQQELVKNLVAVGDTAKAQGVILDALETKFNGAAAAARNTFTGSLNAAKVEVGELMEKLGEQLIPVIRQATEWVAKNGERFTEIAGVIGRHLADAIHLVVLAFKTWLALKLVDWIKSAADAVGMFILKLKSLAVAEATASGGLTLIVQGLIIFGMAAYGAFGMSQRSSEKAMASMVEGAQKAGEEHKKFIDVVGNLKTALSLVPAGKLLEISQEAHDVLQARIDKLAELASVQMVLIEQHALMVENAKSNPFFTVSPEAAAAAKNAEEHLRRITVAMANLIALRDRTAVRPPEPTAGDTEMGEAVKDYIKSAKEKIRVLDRQARASMQMAFAMSKGTQAIKDQTRANYLLTNSAKNSIPPELLRIKAVQEWAKAQDDAMMNAYDWQQVQDADAEIAANHTRALEKQRDAMYASQDAWQQYANAKRAERESAQDSLTLLERDFQWQLKYAAAVKKGTQAIIEFNKEKGLTDWVTSHGGRVGADGSFLGIDPEELERARKYFAGVADEATRTAEEIAKWKGLREAADVFGQIDSKLGNIANKMIDFGAAIKAIREGAGDITKKMENWAQAATAAVGILKESGLIAGPGGGTSEFGGRMSGTYASEGAAVGAVVGAIVGAIATWGAGAGAGAAIGSAIGEVFGSLIKKGADEGLIALQNSTAEYGSKFGVVLTGMNNKVGRTAMRAGQELVDIMNDIVNTLGGEIAGISQMTMKIRDKDIIVVVNGIRRVFQEMGDAVSFAATEILRTAQFMNLDPLYEAALRGNNADNLEGLKGDLEAIAQIISFGFTDSQNNIRAFESELDRLAGVLLRTVTDVGQAQRGFGNLAAEEIRRWQAERDNLTGHQQSNAEKLQALQADAMMWNAEKNLRLAELQAKKQNLLAQNEMAKAQVRIWGGTVDAEQAFLRDRSDLLGAEFQMFHGFLAATTDTMQAAGTVFEAYMIALDQMIAALENMPDIDIPRLHLPNMGGGGGGGSTGPSERQQRADAFNQFIEQQGLTGLSQYQTALAQLTAAFAEQVQASHEVANGEALLAEARRNAMAQLRENLIDQMGLPLEAVRDRMQTLIDQAADFYASNVELQRQFDAGEISIEEFTQAVRRSQQVAHELAMQAESDILNQALYFADAMKDDKLSMAIRKQIAILEWTLKVAEFKLSLETYHNLKRISDDMYKAGMALLGEIEKFDPTTLVGGDDPGYQENNTDQGNPLLDALNKALDRLRNAVENLQKSNEALLLSDKSPLTLQDQFSEAQRRYNETLAAARNGDVTAIENFAGVRDQYLALAQQMFGTAGAGYQSIFQQSLQAGQDLAAAGQAILDAIPPQMQGTEIRLDNIADILRLMASQMGVHPTWNPGTGGTAPNAPGPVIGRLANVTFGNFNGRNNSDPNVVSQLQTVNDNLVAIAHHQAAVATEARNDRMMKPSFTHANGLITKRGA